MINIIHVIYLAKYRIQIRIKKIKSSNLKLISTQLPSPITKRYRSKIKKLCFLQFLTECAQQTIVNHFIRFNRSSRKKTNIHVRGTNSNITQHESHDESCGRSLRNRTGFVVQLVSPMVNLQNRIDVWSEVSRVNLSSSHPFVETSQLSNGKSRRISASSRHLRPTQFPFVDSLLVVWETGNVSL